MFRKSIQCELGGIPTHVSDDFSSGLKEAHDHQRREYSLSKIEELVVLDEKVKDLDMLIVSLDEVQPDEHAIRNILILLDNLSKSLFLDDGDEPGQLPADLFKKMVQNFFDHDLRGYETSFNFVTIAKMNLEKEKPDYIKVKECWRTFLQFWELYYFVTQDLANRFIDNTEVDEDLVETVSPARVLNCVHRFVDNISRKYGFSTHDVNLPKRESVQLVSSYIGEIESRPTIGIINIDISPDVFDSKISVCDGVLFNKLRNILSNPITMKKSIHAKNIWFTVKIEAGELVILVQDDGKGMTDYVKENMFKEGFTNSNGKGLGLAHAEEQIHSMGGSILVKSEFVGEELAGTGDIHTTFEIRFPIIKN